MKPTHELPGFKAKLSSKRYVHVARWDKEHCWLVKFSNSKGKVHRLRMSDEAMAALIDCVCKIVESNGFNRKKGENILPNIDGIYGGVEVPKQRICVKETKNVKEKL
jgi:hypothetical protein